MPGPLGHSDCSFYFQPRWSPNTVCQPGQEERGEGTWSPLASYTKGSWIQGFLHLFSQIIIFTISKLFITASSSWVCQERCRGLAPREERKRDMEGGMLPTSPQPYLGGRHPGVHHPRPQSPNPKFMLSPPAASRPHFYPCFSSPHKIPSGLPQHQPRAEFGQPSESHTRISRCVQTNVNSAGWYFLHQI